MSTKLAHYGEWAAMVAALPTGALRCKGGAPIVLDQGRNHYLRHAARPSAR